MDLHVDDAGFVRAPDTTCYELLRRFDGWSAWWPGTVVAPLPATGREQADAFDLRVGPRLGGLVLRATPTRARPDRGFVLALAGDVVGEAEVWLEPGWGGTVVHHLLRGRATRVAPARVQRRYRRWARHGLWQAKEVLEARALAVPA